MNIFIKFHKDTTTFVDFLSIAKFWLSTSFIPRRKIVIDIGFDFNNFWQTVSSKFVPYFCHLIRKSKWQLEKTNHKGLISGLVFQLNAPPFNWKLPGLYHLHYPRNSYNILSFEIEGICSAMHCKFFHGKFYRFFLCNFSHYSSTMIFIKIDYKSNYSKIYMNYQWIPWNVLISSIRNIIFIW